MGIKLTTEVKEVIHQMIAITKEFELTDDEHTSTV